MPVDLLVVIAESAVAFAGFSALVVIIPRFAGIPWHAQMATGLWLMVSWSLSAFLFSLIPLVLSEFGLSDVSALRWSSGFLALGIVIQILLAATRDARLSDNEASAEPRRLVQAAGIIALLTALTLAANASGFVQGAAGGIYAAALLVLFALAALPLGLFLSELGSENRSEK